MKKILLIVNTFILAVLAWFSGVKDVYTWLPTVWKPIIVEITPKENVKAGDTINFNYTVPQSGYLALWNWNNKGEIKEMIAATLVNAENYQKSYAIEASNMGGMEHIILLWSEKNRLALADDYYASTSDFNSAVKALGDGIEREEDQVQIYPREQE